MAYKHGVYTSEVATSMVAPITGTAGLQVIVGTAPVNMLKDPAAAVNVPLLVNSYKEAVEAVGYLPDFANYTLCECISANFSVVGIAPMVLINVLDPAKHKVAITGGTVQVNDGVAVLEETGVLLEGLTVKSGSNTLTAGTDYTTTWNDDGTLNIVVLSTGAGKEATSLTVTGNKIDPSTYAVWPFAKVGNTVYSGSALAAALTAYTDAQNNDTPNVSPSNKTISISAACLEDGTEVVLDQEQANTVNSFGVATWLNMNGFRLWGNNTAAYPGISDPKDRWFSVRRFLTWAANTFILTYFQKVDSPANKRLIEAIVDSENVRGNGFVARGVCARYEITFNEDENTTADLLDGKITFHQYITPFTPAEDIEDIIEFVPDALSAALN